MSYGYQFHHASSPQTAARSSRRAHLSVREVQSMKELTDRAAVVTARYRYEAARSFDLDDDLEFCPGLLTEEELQAMHSSSSDRSSNSSGSPESSPLQHQIQPTSTSSTFMSYGSVPVFHPTHHLKLQQPPVSARSRYAIPIVNPNTGMRVSSPPLMIHPSSRTVHHGSRRPW
jgi:hypothetical protein